MLIFSNRKIENIPHIQRFLHEDMQSKTDLYVGWGRKASFHQAQRRAEQHAAMSLCVEDGFIRSIGLGKQGHPPLSLVVDRRGIYFDAGQVSDLELLIQQPECDIANQRAQRAIDQIVHYQITKYNQKYMAVDLARFIGHKNILIVDQTAGDQSIVYAGASPASFQQMLQQARLDHPDAKLWVKTHPDVLAAKAKAHFTVDELMQADVGIISENYNPIELLKQMDEVYVVSSQMGFEALLCGKTVHCFALPWYAAWGLTHDQYAPLHIVQARRQQARSLTHLFSCAYLQYARYVSPVTGKRCELEDMIAILQPNITLQHALPSSLQLFGFSRWKKRFLAAYLDFPQSHLTFKKWSKPKSSEAVVAWGKRAYQLKQQGYSQLCTVEDGFIRSIGLGAALTRPCSLVFDPVGIYYDATAPSHLEHLLNHCQLTDAERERAQQLKQRIIALNISKYNVGVREKLQIDFAGKVILVVGQVDDDMSVQLGGIDIKSNIDLLMQVRALNPEAYIIYKPHPDVQAGLRAGKIADALLLRYANKLETQRSIIECFAVVDEVHTLTSLTGFEALIRGIKVVCYGMPFYAGWGLTLDRHHNIRRTKQLSLDELLYVVLVQYAVYNLDSTNIALTSVESVLDYFAEQSKDLSQSKKNRWMQCLLKINPLRLRK